MMPVDVGYEWVKGFVRQTVEKITNLKSSYELLAAKAKPRSFYSTFLRPLIMDFFLTYHLSI